MKKTILLRIKLFLSFMFLIIQEQKAQKPLDLAHRVAQRLMSETRFQFDTLPMKKEQEKTWCFDFMRLKTYNPNHEENLLLEQFDVEIDKNLIGKKGLRFGISCTKGPITVNFNVKKNAYKIRAFYAQKPASIERLDYDLVRFDTTASIQFDTTYAELSVLFGPQSKTEARLYLGLIDSTDNMSVSGLKIKVKPQDSINWLPTPSVSAFKEASNHNDWRYYNGVNLTALHDLSRYTSAPQYQTHIDRYAAFFIENMPKIRRERDSFGLIEGAFTLYFRGQLLDDLGMQAAALALANLPTDLERKKQQDLLTEQLHKINQYVPRLPDGTFTRITPEVGTVQSDDAMMGGYALLRLGLQKKDPKMIADAVNQSLNFHKYLLDKKTGLYRHAYFAKSKEQSCCSWARGMGWVMILNKELLKQPISSKKIMLKNFQTTCLALLKYQNANGGFHQILTDSTTYLETSATAMFITAFAEGVKRGWLKKSQFNDSILRGYDFVKSKINQQGEIADIVRGTPILPTAEAYNKQKKNLNDPRGIGSVLWMLMAMDAYFL